MYRETKQVTNKIMETKKYIIKDLYSDNEITYFVSDTTTSLEDIWISGYFKDKKRNKDNDNKPKIFNDLKEAKRYLKEVKIGRDKDWRENGWSYKIYGKSKPKWDIYDYVE